MLWKGCVMRADWPEVRPSDEALVAAARTGSVAAFETLAERYYALILRYLTRLSGDAELAADMAQETFLDAFRALGQLPEDRPFAAWLFQVARNNLRPVQRRGRLRRMFSLDALLARVEPLFPLHHRPDSISASHERDLIQQVLDELSPPLREALLLHRLWGFSGQEVAVILGISHAAARKRISRADEAFQARYRAHTGEETRHASNL